MFRGFRQETFSLEIIQKSNSLCTGSGMFVKVGDAWSLKGITAVSMLKNYGDDYGCNSDAFSVFTDVYKFYDWVKEVIGTTTVAD